jgi:N-terminal domain of anti-restriction factor ArdC
MAIYNISDFSPNTQPKLAKERTTKRVQSVAAGLPVISANGGFAQYPNPVNPVTGNAYKGAQSEFLRSPSNQFAGFQQWLSIGRVVRKGEHGIKILMPIPTPEGERQRFMARVVFAVEQTDIAQDKGE